MTHRIFTLLGLAGVTALLVAYGSTEWSWIAGPVAALAVWTLERASFDATGEGKAAAAPLVLEPEPVD